MIRPQIFAFSEEPTDITLFDCRWVPCSTRFVVAGTHAKGHGVLRVYTMGGGEREEIKQLGKSSRTKSSIILKWKYNYDRPLPPI